MATLSITIPDAAASRVLDAIAGEYGYSATLPDGTSNPQTKAQFARQVIVGIVKGIVASFESSAAAQAARDAAIASAQGIAIT